MNEMYKTIVEQYEKDGYESAKKSFMDFVNADRSDVTKDEVMLSYAMMAKLALVNKDSEMAEKLLRLDSKFANSSEESQLDSKTDGTRDKPEQESSVNVKNVLGIEFVELSPNVYVSRTIVTSLTGRLIELSNIFRYSYIASYENSFNNNRITWKAAGDFCDSLSRCGIFSSCKFRLPSEYELSNIIKCHKEKGIQLEPPSVYELSSDRSGKRDTYHVAYNSEGERVALHNEGYIYQGGIVDTAFRVIMEPKH